MSRGDWSIDDLARLTEVPTRTIREYRTLGLLPPPAKVGRVGRYTEEHRRRLELIGRLQARGYSLAGIHDLFDAWDQGRSLHELIGGGALDETPAALSSRQLADRLPALSDGDARDAAVDAGLLVAAGEDRWLVRSESLLAIVADVTNAGVALDAGLAAVRQLRALAQGQADVLTELFVTEIWNRANVDDPAAFARRARPLIAQAVASLVTDALGAALARYADDSSDAALAGLIEEIRVGAVTEPAPAEPRRDHT
jgi:DNA-binding transcriptional MerR regulator